MHYEKCQEILADLSTLGLSDRQKAEFLSLLSAILVAGSARTLLLHHSVSIQMHETLVTHPSPLRDFGRIGRGDMLASPFFPVHAWFSDVVSFKMQNELHKEELEAEKEEEPPAPAAPRVRRITRQSGQTVERTLMVGKKTGMTLAGLDIINLVSEPLK